MSLPVIKIAVYYGTITLDTGDPATFTAAGIADLYNVADQDYLAVPLAGLSPFLGGKDESSYIHLKPLPDARYYDAKQRYNIDYDVQLDDDFNAHTGGKWAVRPAVAFDEGI